MPTAKKRPVPKPINPYGDNPISDFLVSANASMGEYMPFGGMLDRAGLGVNRVLGIGPQSLADIDRQRSADMLKSVPGAVTGAGVGMAGNALLPMQGIIANMLSGALEGGTSDPEKPFSIPGAGFGAGMQSIPLLKFLKLDPRGLPPESFVRTLPAKTKELAGNLNIPEMILQQTPRQLQPKVRKLFGMEIPKNILPDFVRTKRKDPEKNWYEASARMMRQTEKKMADYYDYFTPRSVKENKKLLDEVGGLQLGDKAIAMQPGAIPHEGIHAAIAHGGARGRIERDVLENVSQLKMNSQYPDVVSKIHELLGEVGYEPGSYAAELLPVLHGVLSQPNEKKMMIRLGFGGDAGAYQQWAKGAKKAYQEIVKWAKEVTPEEVRKLGGKVKPK